MKPDVPLRLGMIGCGGIADTHAKAAGDLSDTLGFVAAYDTRLSAAESWAARHQVPATYSDIASMVRAGALDGVVVATWPSAHCESILGALAAGVANVLSEKPLTLIRNDAVKVWDAAHDAGAFITEG